MIVFPMMRDQPDNARRIVHHHLGTAGDFQTATATDIAALVRRIDEDPAIRPSVNRLQQRFHEVEESGLAVRRIEEALNGKAARPAA
jgi:UDP:flavonoid glycosyltransferase YjiC (YdhE family)